MGKDADELFVEIALEKGLLTREQADQCLADQAMFAQMGYPRSLAQITREKRVLGVRQVTDIRRSMAERGVLPKLGGYELIARLGEGGMGTVYKARQIKLNRTVALKVLSSHLNRNETYVKRFEREGRLAAQISHPNAVQVFDVGEDSGRHYIAMEYVAGSDVAKALDQGPMVEKRALEILRGVVEALAVAHEQGVVHRDIKPPNILLNKRGQPKLSDLGIAKQASVHGTTLTKTGVAVGTPQYMSPEQCQGAKDTDARADIYSLGATLYHMVCGEPPFTGATAPSVMHKHVYEPLPDPRVLAPGLSDGVVGLICRMMEKHRDARLQTCAEVLEAIEAVETGTVTAVPPPAADVATLGPDSVVYQAPTDLGRPERRDAGTGRRWESLLPGIGVAIVALAVLLAVGGVVVYSWRQNTRVEKAGRLFASARSFLELNRVQEAEKQLLEGLRARPDDPRFKLAIAYIEARRRAEAADAGTDWLSAADHWKRAADHAQTAGLSSLASEAEKRAASAKTMGAERARRKAESDRALAEGNRLLEEQRWKEAEAAFRSVLKIAGYEKDREAQEGIARATKARAYAHELRQAKAAYNRATRAKSDVRLWHALKAAAERAMETGHTDVSAAEALAKEAQSHLAPPSWAKVSQAQLAAAAKANVPAAREIDLGGGVSMKLVYIPPGEFTMGSDNGGSDEKPVRRVTLTRAFYMGMYEVTQAQWRAVMGNNPAYFKGDDRPVEMVSWSDCQEFIRKLNALGHASGPEGTFRLPTEAEWEYACRAGTNTKYHWGDGSPDVHAWYASNSGSQTQPVGRKRPNAFGLCDMTGNVWEWCGDWYDKGYYAKSPSSDPQGPASGSHRVLRGGSWHFISVDPRSVYRGRHYHDPSRRHYYFGFRVVLLSRGVRSVAAPKPKPSAAGVPTAKRPREQMARAVPAWAKVSQQQIQAAERAGVPAAKEVALGGGVRMKMVYIPPGSFMMGSEKGGNEYSHEKPVHRVTLTRGFCIGIYEVTQAQWQAVMGVNPARFRGNQRPVEPVSWDDCQEFIRKLNARASERFRLPTEAEWEYACRAGTRTAHYWGDGSPDAYAWYRSNSRRQTHPVGQKLPNAFITRDSHEWR